MKDYFGHFIWEQSSIGPTCAKVPAQDGLMTGRILAKHKIATQAEYDLPFAELCKRYPAPESI